MVELSSILDRYKEAAFLGEGSLFLGIWFFSSTGWKKHPKEMDISPNILINSWGSLPDRYLCQFLFHWELKCFIIIVDLPVVFQASLGNTVHWIALYENGFFPFDSVAAEKDGCSDLLLKKSLFYCIVLVLIVLLCSASRSSWAFIWAHFSKQSVAHDWTWWDH